MSRIAVLLLCCCPSLVAGVNGQDVSVKAQSVAGTTQPFAYDIISIKQVIGEPQSGGWADLQDGFSMRNLPLRSLITGAYGIRDDELTGMPKWANSLRFDVEARMAPEMADALHKLDREQQEYKRQLMLQSVLEDRFRLRIHRSTEARTAYELIIARSGLKMKENHQTTDIDGNKWQEGVRPSTDWMITDRSISGHAMPFSVLADHLQGAIDAIVVDKTGLTARYDIALHWNPSDIQSTDSSEPSLFSALKEQLGLQLKPVKTQVQVVTIDHLEMPSPN